MKELMEEISKKNERALEDFYIENKTLLFNIAYSIMANSEDSEEVVNDIVQKVWELAPVLCNLKNPIGYIVTITHNLSIDRVRTKKNKPVIIDYEFIKDDTLSTSERVHLNNVLSSLNEDLRTVLILKLVYKYTYFEISSLTGFTFKVVRNMYSKAIKQFKNLYWR